MNGMGSELLPLMEPGKPSPAIVSTGAKAESLSPTAVEAKYSPKVYCEGVIRIVTPVKTLLVMQKVETSRN